MNRRKFFASLLAPLVAMKIVKAQTTPKPPERAKDFAFVKTEDMRKYPLTYNEVFWIKNRRGGMTLMVHEDHKKEVMEIGDLYWQHRNDNPGWKRNH